jgi:hypothetical protein
LGAANGYGWLGPLVVFIVVSCHLRFLASKGEAWLVSASVLVGTVAESVLVSSGVVVYRADPPPVWLCPPWISAMWANIAITLRHSLGWLEPRSPLTWLIGGVGGPCAYYAGARLGAIEWDVPSAALAAFSLLWASAIPGLLWLSGKLVASERRSQFELVT